VTEFASLALPAKTKCWSFRSLLVNLIKIGAKLVEHGRYLSFQMAEVSVSGEIFAEFCRGLIGNCNSKEGIKTHGESHHIMALMPALIPWITIFYVKSTACHEDEIERAANGFGHSGTA